MRTSISVDQELLDWFDSTFPGLDRSWFVTHCLKRMKKKFEDQHYVTLTEKVVDSIYDDLQR